MKYKAHFKSVQIIQIAENMTVWLSPEGGDVSKSEAKAITQTAWGKRLIETGLLMFEEKPDIEPAPKRKGGGAKEREDIPDFDGGGEAA